MVRPARQQPNPHFKGLLTIRWKHFMYELCFRALRSSALDRLVEEHGGIPRFPGTSVYGNEFHVFSSAMSDDWIEALQEN
jgi:hypothetical protein